MVDSVFQKIIEIVKMSENCDLKDQRQSRKNNTIHGSAFRDLRKLDESDQLNLLKGVISQEISIKEMSTQAKELKMMRNVQRAMVKCLSEVSWADVEKKYAFVFKATLFF